MGCQDAGRRGARCSGRLEELEVFYTDVDTVCVECEEDNREESVETEEQTKEKEGEVADQDERMNVEDVDAP